VHIRGVASPAGLAVSPERATVHGVNASAAEGAFLTGEEVRDLLRLRSRASLQNMRARGDLIAHQLPNGYFLYPEDQPTIRSAREALRAAAKARPRTRRAR
jgi:hypothetical protein